ncbi:TetR/AcrR family transcriptional regulator, partial [Oleiphilus sp. HI0067]
QDLRNTLLENAEALMSERGIAGLTLRELAERSNVSRQAPYHHFSSKHALLCAVAERSFDDLNALLDQSGLSDDPASIQQRLKDYVIAYVRYAAENPEKYELMFGAVTWRNEPSPELTEKGHATFRRYTKIISQLKEQGGMPSSFDATRMSQTTWATLHGLCRLKTDGVFVSLEAVEEMSLYAAEMILSVLKGPTKSE